MIRYPRANGWTLVELMVSVAIIVALMGMVAGIAKNVALYRITSERKLKLSEKLQRVMFFIENDLLSARRHTLGNVLCNNIVFDFEDESFRTTSDPGFDLDYPSLSPDPLLTKYWNIPRPPLIPGPNTEFVGAMIDRSPNQRLFGTGSMAVWTSRNNLGLASTVRSPLIKGLRNNTNYVLAGWVRGDNTGGTSFLTSRIYVTRGGLIVASTETSSANWVYLTAKMEGNASPNSDYYVFLETRNSGTPTRVCTGYFDNITLTPTNVIANIDFANVSNGSPENSNVNLNIKNKYGMVFYQSNPTLGGDMREMNYIFCNGGMGKFPVPATDIDLFRFSASAPYFSPTGNSDETDWDNFKGEQPLRDVSRLRVSWLGGDADWILGANRPIQVDVTVRDHWDANKTMTLSRTLLPPTD